MGNIVKRMSRNRFDGLVLDFDGVGPETESDKELYEEAKLFLAEAEDIVRRIESYQASAALSRKALADPTPENRWYALESVSMNAMEIYHFWRFSQRCGQLLTKFLSVLVSDVDASGEDLTDPSGQLQLSSRASLIKQFGEIMSAVIRFDRAKAMASSIQNDLSFYRRIVTNVYQPCHGMASETAREFEEKLLAWEQSPELTDTVVSTLSFFIASPVPVMQDCCIAITKLSEKNEIVQVLIPFIPNLYVHLIKKKVFAADSPHNWLALQAMVGFIIMTDRVEPEGAFHSHSLVRINDAITILENFHKHHPALDKEEQVFNLVDCLKYWSLHLQDDSTPSKIAWRLMM